MTRVPEGAGPRRTVVFLTGSGAALLDALERALAANGHTVRRVGQSELSPLPANGDIVFTAFDHPAKNELESLDALCTPTTRWVPLRWQGGRVCVGPAVSSAESAGFRDLMGRHLAAAPDEHDHDASRTRSGEQLPRGDDLAWTATTAAGLFDQWKADARSAALTNAEVELDPAARTVQRHALLALPNRERSAFSLVTGSAGLVDARTGIVLRVRDVPTGDSLMPPDLHLAVAEVADMRRLFDWPNDRRAFGSSWGDSAGAHHAAVGEAAERYCGNWPGPHTEIEWAKYDALRARGENAVDPDELALYSSGQYDARGFPFAPFRRDSPAAWVRGWSLTRGRPVWVPAFLAFVAWRHHCPEEERYCYPNLTGVAAGTSPGSAMVSGLEEVIERDASMTWWSHRVALPPVALPARVRKTMSTVGDRFEPRVLALPNQFGVPIAAGVVRDRETGWLTIGTAVRPNFLDAAFKAVAEGYSLQSSCRALDDEVTSARLVRAGVQSVRNLKPWQRNRGYLAAYREDFHDVVDLMCQLQVNLDPEAVAHVSGWAWTTLPSIPEPAVALPDRSLDVLQRKVERQGFEVIKVDLTTPDVAAVGMHVVRAVVPGLVANFPAAFPMWGRKRISRAGVHLGWQDAPLDEHELSTFPMPHA